MTKDIQDIRRANLARWLETHSVPPNERSLFSQLKGTGSFGERVARRLERDYGMGDGYLDRIDDSSNTGQKVPLTADALNLIQWVTRLDAISDPARKMFPMITGILQVANSLPQSQNMVSGIDEFRRAEQSLRDATHGGSLHATKRRTK
jgi:hypothetical protein